MWRHYKEYFCDECKFELNKLRNELFFYAADGKISFNDPIYKYMMQRLNVAIEVADEISLLKCIYLCKIDPDLDKAVKEEKKHYCNMLEDISSREQKEFIKRIDANIGGQLMEYLIRIIPFVAWIFYIGELIDVSEVYKKKLQDYGNRQISSCKKYRYQFARSENIVACIR